MKKFIIIYSVALGITGLWFVCIELTADNKNLIGISEVVANLSFSVG